MARTARPMRTPVRKGRVVAVFGPAGVGKSMLIGLVSAATKHPTTLALSAQALENAIQPHVHVVFVEVNKPEDVEYLITEGHISAANDGAFVKVLPETLSPTDDLDWEDCEKAIEEMIRVHMVPHFTVVNKHKDPMSACIGLAKAAKLKA